MTDKTIIGKECRFVVYVPPPSPDKPDLHFVKENVHYSDGTTSPNTRIFYDFKRPYWVVHKGARNYTQPKEWIDLEFVTQYETTQTRLVQDAARTLGMPYFKGSLRQLSQNPYLFGTDIKSTAIIKHAYQTKYKDTKPTYYSYASFDVETDVLHGSEEIVLATTAFKNLVITAVIKDFVKGCHDPDAKIKSATSKYLHEYVDKENLVNENFVVDSEIDAIKTIFKRLHELKPDFLGIWNIDFDLRKVMRACEKADFPIEELLSDPSIPKEYRYFRYEPGAAQKKMASGRVMPLPNSARWSTVQCPASFYLIDAMQVFKQVRLGKPERPSYSLDAILSTELNLGKLKFDAAKDYDGLAWHIYMQKNYPIEYSVYNKFDSYSMLLLDRKNKDVSFSLPLYSNASDFADFKSQPRRAMDKLHWYCLQNGKVIGTTNATVSDEYTKSINVSGWITNLAAPLITEQGQRLIIESPHIVTTIYTNVGDLDVASSYPNGIITYNISKETTSKEILEVVGIPRRVYERDNMLLMNGHTDAIQWCTSICQFPNTQQLLADWDTDHT